MTKTLRTGVIQPLPGMGDMIWYLPALQSIAAASGGSITLFARPSAQAHSVLKTESMLAAIVDLPLNRRGVLAAIPIFFKTWFALLRARPDRLFILHQSPRYRIAARMAGIRNIVSYPPDLGRAKQDGWQKSLIFLKQQGIPVAAPESRLAVDPQIVGAMRQRYSAMPKPWMIIAPGATENARMWPVENFAVCAGELVESFGGTVFLVGSAREADTIAAIQRLSCHEDRIVPLAGLPFDQVMGLIVNSAFLLGNDSGPANVAAALGIPAFPLCGISKPPLHSPNLHLITPPSPSANDEGMRIIDPPYVLSFIRSIIKAA
jgi:heptosyltransferase-2